MRDNRLLDRQNLNNKSPTSNIRQSRSCKAIRLSIAINANFIKKLSISDQKTKIPKARFTRAMMTVQVVGHFTWINGYSMQYSQIRRTLFLVLIYSKFDSYPYQIRRLYSRATLKVRLMACGARGQTLLISSGTLKPVIIAI